ncbi:hypothetical protein ACI2JA_02690 [Alkalihalobacillus sp. NPDC078783]
MLELPKDSGTWVGTSSKSTVTRDLNYYGVVTILAGAVLGLGWTLAGIAGGIDALSVDTTYYNQYQYISIDE